MKSKLLRVEPELTGPIPRRVVLSWGNTVKRLVPSALLLVSVFVIIAGRGELFLTVPKTWGMALLGALSATVVVFGYLDLSSQRVLVEGGIAARGTVVEVSRVRRRGRFGIESGVDYRNVIEYEAPVPTRIVSGHHDLALGDTVTALYRPEEPEKAMLYRDCLYKPVVAPEENN